MKFNRQSINWYKVLTTNYFSFGRVGEQPYTNSFYFHENGQVHFGLEPSQNEAFWRIDDAGKLVIEDNNHKATTIFIFPQDVAEPIWGDFQADASIKHEIKIISPITANAELMAGQALVLQQQITSLNNQLVAQTSRIPARAKRGHIRVAFVLNAVETMDALLILIKALLADPLFEVRVLTFNRIFRNVEQTGTKVYLDEQLAAQGISVVASSHDADADVARLKHWGPDFLIRQSEWDQDFPPAVSASNLAWTRLAHVAYTITENFLNNPNSGMPMFTQEYFEHVWRSFVPVPLTEAEQVALATTFISPEIFTPIGSIKAIQLQQIQPAWPETAASQKVIWMPHHSIDAGWFQFGTFDQNYEQMYAWTKNHPDISVILNPHPSLPSVIASGAGALTAAEFEAFLAKWQALPNAEYLIHKGSYPQVAAADVVLSDGISVLYEAQVMSKPIIYIENKTHVEFTPYGAQLMQGVHSAQGLDAALSDVERLLVEPDELADAQRTNVAPLVANQHPEQLIINEMLAEMEE